MPLVLLSRTTAAQVYLLCQEAQLAHRVARALLVLQGPQVPHRQSLDLLDLRGQLGLRAPKVPKEQLGLLRQSPDLRVPKVTLALQVPQEQLEPIVQSLDLRGQLGQLGQLAPKVSKVSKETLVPHRQSLAQLALKVTQALLVPQVPIAL